MALNTFPDVAGLDNQVFEYTDSLSYEIPTGQRHLKRGDVVVINKDGGEGGILLTDINPGTTPSYDYGQPPMKPTWGLNGTNHATVRRNGGVFRVEVDGAGVTGAPVYATAPTDSPNKAVVGTVAPADDANAIVLGTLYKDKTAGKGEAYVVLHPSAIK